MGIALLALADLFAPLQSMAHRWMPRREAGASHPDDAGLRYVAVRPGHDNSPGARRGRPGRSLAPHSARPTPATRVVRVVRLVDEHATPAPQPAGRVLISGRMADVCAELDRLAAREAASAGSLH